MDKIVDASPPALFPAVCGIASTAVRICSYIFLRWIPGHHFPGFVFTAFAVYLSSFAALYLNKSALKEVARNESVVVTEASTDGVEQDEAEAVLLRDMGRQKKKTVKPHSLEATETVVYERRDPHPIKSLLFGLPTPSSGKRSLAALAINTALFLMVWDLTFRTTFFYPANDLSFARIGFVGPNTAKIVVREPEQSHWPLSVWYQVLPDPEKAVGRVQEPHMVDSVGVFTNATDFTKTLTIPRLSPETSYRWFTSSNHTGTFTTAPKPGTPPKSGQFTFLATSCIKARFPYNPLAHPLSIKGFRALTTVAKELEAKFAVFLGDWIYIDVPRRPGKEPKHYRQQYREVYASPDWEPLGSSLPFIHVPDDHEIANDWDQGEAGVYDAAIEPFRIYQHDSNPPAVRKTGEQYYTFEWGSSASFFMLDTRTYRSPNDAPDGPEKSMLGATQRDDLLRWLKTPSTSSASQWKIIISSVPFTKNWRFGGNDTWGGFPHERQKILEAMWDVGHHGRGGVVVLSGDRHEFAATAFPPPFGGKWRQEATVHEFSCSPLSQFYLPVRTYKQTDERDVLVKYVPDGNVKFGAVTVDTTNEEQAVLKYQLFIDAEEKWSWVLTAPAKNAPAERKKRGWLGL